MDVCVDCKIDPVCVTTRRRGLCHRCFVKFVNVKVWRRIHNYLTSGGKNNTDRTFLLPLSLGLSSLSLLEIANKRLDRDRAKDHLRSSHHLHVLIIDAPSLNAAPNSKASRIDTLRSKFPHCTFTEIPLHSVFTYDQHASEFISQYLNHNPVNDPCLKDEEILNMFRNLTSTATSRVDMEQLLLKRLIIAFAKEHGCDGVLWGDSDTRLAEKTLAGVATGRGAALSWEVCDGMTPWDIYFTFPLRDLFMSEIKSYALLEFPDLLSAISAKETKSFENQTTKTMSIQDLMSQYVQQQGGKYPGVMANIVRTVDKLQAPQLHGTTSCVSCGVPLQSNQMDATTLKLLEQSNRPGATTNPTCYGCARTFLDLQHPS
ncbi:cytoplasmic tRNA 2-thiolation protein 2 [Myotisia sp. PD_48]|nr:cytoplasmic tRNA 2-thiolation protein 2 [Myotisia sp. PD_48]